MVASKRERFSRARPDRPRAAGVLGRALCLVTVLLTGCSVIPDAPPLEPVAAPTRERIESLPTRPPEPLVVQTEAAAPIVIVVSSTLPAYMDVAQSLASLLPASEYVVQVLDDVEDERSSVASPLEPLEADLPDPRAVVAIGLPAALYAQANIAAPLVFCQVLNYADHPELRQATAGISMLPAFDEQLAFWKAIDASLQVVGTIAGPGHEELLAKSTSAAADQGIRLESRISKSDRETVYQFKRLSAEIDGFWLIPDNRILSIGAIEELMAYAASRRLPVVVSTPELLRFGALMSLAPSPAQVANSVVAVLASLQEFIAAGFEVVAPSGFEVDVNPAVASRLGIGVD